MSTHTPGPWKRKGMRGLDIHGADHTVARTGNLSLPEDELQANARLIEAAPDLLEALKGLVGVADTRGVETLQYFFERVIAEVPKARAVIALAEEDK